jgi:hypothetical protein
MNPKEQKKTINVKVAHFNCFKGDKTDIGKGYYKKLSLQVQTYIQRFYQDN